MLQSIIYSLSLHDALPIFRSLVPMEAKSHTVRCRSAISAADGVSTMIPAGWSPRSVHRATKSSRSEEHTSELQSRGQLVCRLLLEKKNFYILSFIVFVAII